MKITQTIGRQRPHKQGIRATRGIWALALALWSLPAFAVGGENRTPCINSAADMFKACRVDAYASLAVTMANCRQFPARADRARCFGGAYEELDETQDYCGEQRDARISACRLLGEKRYLDPLIDAETDFIDPDDIPGIYPNNPYVILQAGHTFVLSDEDEIIIVHVTDEAREIQGVQCRVVVDVVVEEGEDDGEVDYLPIEVTDDWFAQDTNANVYYCGEVARNFEDEVLRDLDGSFEAGLDFAKGGFLVKAMPAPPMAHRQEYALGEAEDIIEYLELNSAPGAEEGGENDAFPCAGGCLKTREFAPLEPEGSEYKYFLPGVGFVLAVALEDGEVTGEREELVCVGDSLDVLSDASCGIEDPDELLEDLCEMHGAFCPDDDEDDDG